jgi:hypothetical protein
MSDAPSPPPPFIPRRRLWLGYAVGTAVVLVGICLRLAHAAAAKVLYRRFAVLREYGYQPIFEAMADIGVVVTCFGFGVLLLTLHHHYQSGAAPHGGRGFEPLPPPR